MACGEWTQSGAVVLTGAGDRAFCTGVDRTEAADQRLLPEAPGEDRPNSWGSTPFMFSDAKEWLSPKTNGLWKPVIAAVNGMACGGAFYLLGEADIILAAEHATFFDPHVTYGITMAYESAMMRPEASPARSTADVAARQLGADDRPARPAGGPGDRSSTAQ